MKTLITLILSAVCLITFNFTKPAAAEELILLGSSSEGLSEIYTWYALGNAVGESSGASSVFTAANPVTGTILIVLAVGVTVFAVMSNRAHASEKSSEKMVTKAKMIDLASTLNSAAAHSQKRIDQLSSADIAAVDAESAPVFKEMIQSYRTALKDPSMQKKVDQSHNFTDGEIALLIASNGLMAKHGLFDKYLEQ